jgi:hypothetical protein
MVRIAHPTISRFALVWLEYSAVRSSMSQPSAPGQLAKQVSRWLGLGVFYHRQQLARYTAGPR